MICENPATVHGLLMLTLQRPNFSSRPACFLSFLALYGVVNVGQAVCAALEMASVFYGDTRGKGASIYDVHTEGGRGVSPKEDVVREVA